MMQELKSPKRTIQDKLAISTKYNNFTPVLKKPSAKNVLKNDQEDQVIVHII